MVVGCWLKTKSTQNSWEVYDVLRRILFYHKRYVPIDKHDLLNCGLPRNKHMSINMTELSNENKSLFFKNNQIRSDQSQLCPTLCDPMNRSMPGLPVHHQLLEFTQTHVYRVSDAIQPSHPLSSPSPLAPNPSQHQSLFQWVNSLHEVAKVLEFQL